MSLLAYLCNQLSQAQESIPFQSSHPDQAVINPRTGKPERVFVNLDAVYPNPKDPSLEMSFEELRSANRGWMSKMWQRPGPKPLETIAGNKQSQRLKTTIPETKHVEALADDLKNKASLAEETIQPQDSFDFKKVSEKPARPKRLKVREISQETQTSKQTKKRCFK